MLGNAWNSVFSTHFRTFLSKEMGASALQSNHSLIQVEVPTYLGILNTHSKEIDKCPWPCNIGFKNVLESSSMYIYTHQM